MITLKPFEQDILKFVQKYTSEVAGVEQNQVHPMADVDEDLGLSTEEVLQILNSLEKQFDIIIRTNSKREFLQELGGGTTVMDIIDLIAEELE